MQLPAPEIAIKYYQDGDLYLFEEFQITSCTEFRRPTIENLYDVFAAILDDELEHIKITIACQQPEARDVFQSPHNANRYALPESIKAAIEQQTSRIVGEINADLGVLNPPTK